MFGWILDTYKLVKLPVEPYASERVAPHGMFWLKVTDCSVRRLGRRYHARIRLVMFNHDLDPPFEAVYEQDRTLSYQQLQREFRNLQVFLNHPSAVQEACAAAVRTFAYANCLPEDAPPWMGQKAESN